MAKYAGRQDDPFEKWVQRMQEALEDDFWNYDSDGGFDGWYEWSFDNPSNAVNDLWKEVPEDQELRYGNAVEEIMQQLKHEN